MTISTQGNTIKRQLLLVHLIVLLTYIGLTLPYTIFPNLFINDSSSRMVLYSLLVSVYPLGQAIGMIIFGGLSDSFGRKRILLWTLAGAIFTFILSGISLAMHHYYLLIFIRFFCGMFEGNYTIALAIINDLSSHTENKKKWYGSMNVALTIGFIVGPFLGTAFSNSNHVSWFNDSTPFYFAAIISIVTFTAVKIYFQETLITRVIKVNHYITNYFRKISYCFQNPTLARLIKINLFSTVAVDILYIFIPVYMVHKWNAEPELLVIALLVLSLGKIFGNGYLINMTDRIFKTPVNVVFMSLIVFITIMTLLFSVHEITSYLALLFAAGLCIAFSITNLTVFISDVSDNQTIGLVLSVTQGLRIFLEAIFCNLAALSCYISFSMPFVMSAGFSLAALVSLVIYAKKYSVLYTTR